MQTIEQTYNAGETKRFSVPGRYFRLMATTTPVNVDFYLNNSHQGSAQNVEAGFSWAADTTKKGMLFDRVEIYTASAQTLKFAASEFEIRYDRSSGSVDVKSTPAPVSAFAQAGATVGLASGQLLAANAARRFLMVQNNDAASNVYLNLAGAAAAVAGGVKLPPGGSIVLDVATPSAAIFAIADVATAANALTVIEG